LGKELMHAYIPLDTGCCWENIEDRVKSMFAKTKLSVYCCKYRPYIFFVSEKNRCSIQNPNTIKYPWPHNNSPSHNNNSPLTTPIGRRKLCKTTWRSTTAGNFSENQRLVQGSTILKDLVPIKESLIQILSSLVILLASMD
jgi:hypothetical protein